MDSRASLRRTIIYTHPAQAGQEGSKEGKGHQGQEGGQARARAYAKTSSRHLWEVSIAKRSNTIKRQQAKVLEEGPAAEEDLQAVTEMLQGVEGVEGLAGGAGGAGDD